MKRNEILILLTEKGVEIWRDIEGYEGIYMISNLGIVRMTGRIDARGRYLQPRIMKTQITKWGYERLGLRDMDGNREFHTIHRLVLSTFFPIPNMEEVQVNHIDEDKLNNRLDNLNWMTAKQNYNYGGAIERSASKRRKKIFAISMETGDMIEFNAIIDVVKQGFKKNHVIEAINNRYGKQGNLYKGYRWWNNIVE